MDPVESDIKKRRTRGPNKKQRDPSIKLTRRRQKHPRVSTQDQPTGDMAGLVFPTIDYSLFAPEQYHIVVNVHCCTQNKVYTYWMAPDSCILPVIPPGHNNVYKDAECTIGLILTSMNCIETLRLLNNGATTRTPINLYV